MRGLTKNYLFSQFDPEGLEENTPTKTEGLTDGPKVLDGDAVAAIVGVFVGRRVRLLVGTLVGATGLSLGEGLGSFVGNILGTGARVATGAGVTGLTGD